MREFETEVSKSMPSSGVLKSNREGGCKRKLAIPLLTPSRMHVKWSQSTLSMDTQIITTEQDYNKARSSHVTKRGHTEVLAKPTK